MIKSFLISFPARALRWLSKANSEENGVPSCRRYNVSAVIAAILLFCAYDVVTHSGLRTESITILSAALTGTLGLFGITYKQ